MASADPNIVIAVVGNKLDLAEESPQLRQVRKEDAERFVKSQHLKYYETSAKKNINVDDVFLSLLKGI